MPHKDPMTGCMVMTNAEFWAAEGEAEGKSGAEVQAEFYAEWDAEIEKERASLHDPAEAMILLKGAHRYMEGGIPPARKVLAVLHVNYSETMRESRTEFWALAERGHGANTVIDVVHYLSWYDGGSYWEPPEGDTYMNWEGLQ